MLNTRFEDQTLHHKHQRMNWRSWPMALCLSPCNTIAKREVGGTRYEAHLMSHADKRTCYVPVRTKIMKGNVYGQIKRFASFA